MLPLWCVIRIGSERKKGFPLVIALPVVYLLWLIIAVPVLILLFFFFLAGERGRKGKTSLIIYLKAMGVIRAARGLSIDVEDKEDRVRIYVK